jgi:rRNA-processing protein FCF1
MVKVILDSNFLFAPFQFQIDIFEELGKLLGKAEPIILTTTLEEIETLARKRSPKTSIQALAALELAKKCKTVEAKMKLRESYDDVILRTAVDSDYLVATNDSDLRKKLREAGVAVIFLRQKSHLEIEGRFPH